MIDIIKIIGIGFITLFCTVLLKEYKKDFAIYTLLVGSFLIISMSFDILVNIVTFINDK